MYYHISNIIFYICCYTALLMIHPMNLLPALVHLVVAVALHDQPLQVLGQGEDEDIKGSSHHPL